MQSNINVGSENSSKLADNKDVSGVVGKVVPVLAVLVLPKYENIDLIKMLAVNDSPYWPAMRLASGNGVSLELLVRGGFEHSDIEVFGYSGIAPGMKMNCHLLEGYVETLSKGTDFINYLPDVDLDLQLVLNDVLRHDYLHGDNENSLPAGLTDGIMRTLRVRNNRIVQLYDAYVEEVDEYWDISKLMVLADWGCIHIDQLETVAAMHCAWIGAVHNRNGENIPFSRVVDTSTTPIYNLDYAGCKTWFNIVDASSVETGMSVADLRRVRDEVLIQNFWHLTDTALHNQVRRDLVRLNGREIHNNFSLQDHLDTLLDLPFLRDSLSRSSHRIRGVCITHPGGSTEYHQIRRKGVYTDRAFSIITQSNLTNLILACPTVSLVEMMANGLEFGHSTVSVFTF